MYLQINVCPMYISHQYNFPFVTKNRDTARAKEAGFLSGSFFSDSWGRLGQDEKKRGIMVHHCGILYSWYTVIVVYN